MAVQKFGRIDVWINNAGVYLVGRFEDCPADDFRRVLETNFFGVVHGARAALQQFRKQRRGILVNIDSVVASAPQPFLATLGMTLVTTAVVAAARSRKR